LLLLLILLLYPASLFIYVYFCAGFVMGHLTSSRHVNKLKCIICYHSAHWQKQTHTHTFTQINLYTAFVLWF